jgi:hypothetical protein
LQPRKEKLTYIRFLQLLFQHALLESRSFFHKISIPKRDKKLFLVLIVSGNCGKVGVGQFPPQCQEIEKWPARGSLR